ncbi:MAG TPA: PD-(D/E)XK nuclease family protein [Gaiellaceae bacterium]|nr:PD-(D/E)XK nuclease family protein [Gaiellaceae bacterium]
MSLTLLAGPANAGKVALLLDRYLADIDREPILIVPNRADVDRVERDLLKSAGALLGGRIGTFDDVFEEIAKGSTDYRPPASDAQRTLVARRALGSVSLNGLGASARRSGFVPALLSVLGELQSGLLEPDAVDGDLGRLYAAYRRELDRAGLSDRDLLRARAADRIANELEAWHGRPVFAYGFEDLTGAEWRLLESLAGRTDVTVSVPYEPGRPAFAAVQETAEDLARLADGRIEELPPRFDEVGHPALAHLERALFSDTPPSPVALGGAIRFLEGAGTRSVLELVADEILDLVRAGTSPEQIAVVCPSLDRFSGSLDAVFGAAGIHYALEGRSRLARTAYGAALESLLRFAWLGADRGALFAYLRSPFSGLQRHQVDFLEGRLRGRAIAGAERVEEEVEKLRPGALRAVEALRSEPDPVAAVRECAGAMSASAHAPLDPAATEETRRDLRAYEAVHRLLDELDAWRGLGGEVTREALVEALDDATVPGARAGETGRVAVLDLARSRTRRFEVAFLLGLEEGGLPRRGRESPFLDDAERARLGGRLRRAGAVERDRYLFYTACTRANRRLYLVREAANDEGVPREPSPFWEDVRSVFDADDVVRWTTRRPLSALTRPLSDAKTERERLRAVARLEATDPAEATAIGRANGWERRLDRARVAFTRRTKLGHPLVLDSLGARDTFSVTELERFADCSSAWFVERYLDPKSIDAEVDPKLKGSVAHTTLNRFFAGLPKELGSDRVEPDRVEDAVRFMRACLDDALAGVRMDMTELQRQELDQTLWRDLEALVHAEAETELPLVPRHFEVSFGSDRSPQAYQRGIDLDGITLSGKIDRIDVDPFSARGIVIDYKSGKGAHSAAEIEKELRLQIPLYMLVLRDLVGIEPLGGLYRPLAGARKPRGLLREEAREDGLPGLADKDYLDEETFWERVESARDKARELAVRVREGDVRHDPRGEECPSWCDLWTVCRIRRP